jgi:transcriptional regulator with XRE-family HTH domain
MVSMKINQYKGRYNLAGTRIRAAREEAGISQEDLAQQLQLAGMEIGQNAISRIELGLRVVADYELIYFSSVFGKPVEWFLDES